MSVLLVDGMSILRNTSGAAAHLRRGFSYSFLTQLTSVIKKFKPSLTIVCWEGGFGGRDAIFPDYKNNRKQTPPEIVKQRVELKTLLPMLGVDQAWAQGYEADDVIAHFCNTLPTDILIYSNDKDFLQLVSPRVSVYQRLRGPGAESGRVLITASNFETLTGWRDPKLFFRGQLALGDAVDCVPKLYGVTPTTVHAYFHNIPIRANLTEKLDAFYANSPEMIRNRALMDLSEVRNVNPTLTPGKLDAASALNYLVEIGFASIVKRFNEWFRTYEGDYADISSLP